MLKAKRPTDPAAGKSHRNPFWKTAHAPATAHPQISDAETIKSKPRLGVARAQPAPVPAAVTQTSTSTYSRQNPISNSFNLVRGSSGAQNSSDARNAVSTTVAHPTSRGVPSIPVPVPHQQQPPSSQQQQQYQAHAKNNKSTVSKPDVPVSSHAHRVSVQSLNSINTASTSRSSFERISTENLQHSWGSGATFSTAPSSTIPQSTDSLVRIASEVREGAAGPIKSATSNDRQFSASRRFPLVESDAQRKHVEPSSEQTHGDTQGEQASDALPLPNSEYESPARVRSLRRSKPSINVSTTSIRVATSTTGRESPAPVVQSPTQTKPQEHHRSKSDMLATELAYVRPHRIEEHSRVDHGRATLLARVMATSHTHSPSTASARTMSHPTTQQPRVSSTSQQANPNMTKLKQTSIPRISTSGITTASPMIEQTRQLDSLQSPRKASADNTLSAWTSVKSPTMTSAPAYSTLTSVVMSPNLSSVASPRTLVSGSHHHSDVPAITPSQQHYSLSSAGSTIGRTPYVEADYDSPSSTATPGTPTSHTVRALFSSFTSRSHRNSTPHPLRASSLSNPPITAQEVDSPRVGPAHVLTPPPLPPQSTRPDAPQQSFTQAQIQAQEQFFNITSPRHATADLKTSANSRNTGESRRESVSGLRSPSPNSILRSYGLANNAGTVQSPSINAQKQLLGTPFHSPRTLMSDSEVTTVTTSVVHVTRSTVLMPAGQPVTYGHSIERRSSSSSSRRDSSVVGSTNRSGAPPLPTQTPQSPLQQAQSPVNGGFFGMFRPKSPRHPFPRVESPALPPVPSKTPPPRSATASPSGRRFAFSIPINLRHKPKKSISGASVEAVIGGDRMGGAENSAMSSQGSLLPTRTPDLLFTEFPGGNGQTESGRRFASVMGSRRDAIETDTEIDDGGDDDNDEPPIEMKMLAVQQWSRTTEAGWATSGKRRSRPGVSFELPPSESERDDSGMTAVSVAPGGGRMLRYARTHSRQHQQFSDNESVVF